MPCACAEEICRSGSISKKHQFSNLNKCGKFHACIRKRTILALSRLAIGSLLLSIRCMTNYKKTCSFQHAHYTETMKVVENLLKKLMVKNSFNERAYIEGKHRNCLYDAIPLCTCVPTTYVIEIRKNSMCFCHFSIWCLG